MEFFCALPNTNAMIVEVVCLAPGLPLTIPLRGLALDIPTRFSFVPTQGDPVVEIRKTLGGGKDFEVSVRRGIPKEFVSL